jgi:hypothetical protein
MNPCVVHAGSAGLQAAMFASRCSWNDARNGSGELLYSENQRFDLGLVLVCIMARIPEWTSIHPFLLLFVSLAVASLEIPGEPCEPFNVQRRSLPGIGTLTNAEVSGPDICTWMRPPPAVKVWVG